MRSVWNSASRNARRALGVSVAAIFSAVTANSQSAVPICELSKPDAASTARFGNILAARTLPNGSVIVNDGGRRQLLVLDATLRNSTILIDSSGANVQTYGSHASAVIPYVGDSTLFVDVQGLSLVVIDPSGKIVRAMAPPNARAIQFLWRFPAGFHSQGRFLFRSQ